MNFSHSNILRVSSFPILNKSIYTYTKKLIEAANIEISTAFDKIKSQTRAANVEASVCIVKSFRQHAKSIKKRQARN